MPSKKKVVSEKKIKFPAKPSPPATARKPAPPEQKRSGKERVSTKGRYEVRLDPAILPKSVPMIAGRVDRGAKINDLHPRLQPLKFIDDRAYFVEGGEEVELPNLISVQLDSYAWFLNEGLSELFNEVNPIIDFSGRKMELHFLGHAFDSPKFPPHLCRLNNLTYEAPMKGRVQLVNKETGEIKEQDVFLGAIPLMTSAGTFIINGIERVVVNQLVRSPGVFFRKMPENPRYHGAKIIPKRGIWIEIETDRKGVITCKIDRKRKIPITQLLRIFGYPEDSDILTLFDDMPKGEVDFLRVTLDRDPLRAVSETYQSIYRKIRPGDLATPDNAKQLIQSLFFDFKKYDMGQIARYKLNCRFGLTFTDEERHRVFQVRDFVEILRELVRLNSGSGAADDIDHLSNRRVRSVGELVQNKFRVGLARMERIVKDRMTVMDLETITPMQLINCRPITAAMREFFASSQLSQFMDQTNPLSELAHKRRLSAMGPGGLSRERASFDVRDVHTSHYGRICPIATPEGPNIGLVVHLASYARVNKYGFLETPYRSVAHSVPLNADALVGRMAGETIREGRTTLVREGETVGTKDLARRVVSHYRSLKAQAVPVRSSLMKEVRFFDAEEERKLTVAQWNTPINTLGEILEPHISARRNGEALLVHTNEITHIDIAPKQILSISTSLIPFLEHDDNTRASMGTNMQRQAVPLVRPTRPVVGTGVEGVAARASGHTITAKENGEVVAADAREISLIYASGEKATLPLSTFVRSNQGTCFHMRPLVFPGQKVRRGDVLADGASVHSGELALGQNLLVAYMSWGGYNFEDAIILSDRSVEQGLFDSVHIESYLTDVRDTKLGPEMVTRDIPNVGEAKLKDLDIDGIIRLGATVHEGDILVGKITPKGETELTPEERLLQAIFGDKAKDVKDSSLRLPGGAGGKVVDVQIFNRSDGDELPTGVIKQVKVFVAQTRKIQVGDKMAGRHGNKGVISQIVAKEDMPFLADGTPVDIILNPLGVSSRMNIGQILETHLGWAVSRLGFRIASPALSGVPPEHIGDFLEIAGLPRDGKVQLYDGHSGKPFDRPTTVGVVYMMKLLHLVEDKIHARSVGPYSLVTQQPLGGKAQHGGQRFGEMEVWALEAFGASHVLQEMLTIKSDDVVGRSRAYEAIVKGEEIRKPSTPESFNVLLQELRALGLKPELLVFKEKVAAPTITSVVTPESAPVEVVELAPAETAEDSVPENQRVSEMSEPAESPEQVAAAIESGGESDATGESMERELTESTSEEAMDAA